MTLTEAGQVIMDELSIRSAYYQLTMYGATVEQVRQAYSAEIAEQAILRYRFRYQGVRVQHAT